MEGFEIQDGIVKPYYNITLPKWNANTRKNVGLKIQTSSLVNRNCNMALYWIVLVLVIQFGSFNPTNLKYMENPKCGHAKKPSRWNF